MSDGDEGYDKGEGIGKTMKRDRMGYIGLERGIGKEAKCPNAASRAHIQQRKAMSGYIGGVDIGFRQNGQAASG